MKTYLYIAAMALTTYLIRVLPLTLIRKPIRNEFLRSFLYYVPYVTLSVMTFPAVLTVTGSPIAGAAVMLVGVAGAWCGLGLLPVSLLCCGSSSQAAEGRSFFREMPFPNLLRNLSNRTQAKRKNCNSGGMR